MNTYNKDKDNMKTDDKLIENLDLLPVLDSELDTQIKDTGMMFEVGRTYNYAYKMVNATPETLDKLNNLFSLLDELESIIGDHPSYSIARGELNEILLDVAGTLNESEGG